MIQISQPFVPNAHTQGPIYLVAERAADLIKGDRRDRDNGED